MNQSQDPETRAEISRKRQPERHGLFFPLLLVAIGIFFLLSNLNLISGSFWDLFVTYWPVLMILGGLDGIFRRDGWVGPLFWAGAGGLLLAANLGYLPWDAWYLISRFWPLLIMAIGLDILIGRRGLGGAVFGTLLAVGLIVAVLWLANVTSAGSGDLARQTIDQPLQGATEASVEITSIGERLDLGAQADAARIVTGQIEVSEKADYAVSYRVTSGKGVLVIEPEQGSGWFVRSRPAGDAASWAINLNQNIPQDLRLETIFTEGNLNLSQLLARSLELNNVFSDVTLTLPENSPMSGSVESVFGHIRLLVPRGLAVEIDTSGFIMSNTLPDGFQNRDGGKIVSPEAASGPAEIQIKIEQVFGALDIAYTE